MTEVGRISNSQRVLDILNGILSIGDGFELYPFQIGWYNELVAKPFHLPHPEMTLGVLVVSTPKMFTEVFQPWAIQKYSHYQSDVKHLESQIQDPLDKCMESYFEAAKKALSMSGISQIEVLHDYDLTAKRRPRILMGSCGHAAGAAFYYQKHLLNPEPWPEKKSIGLAVHPVYGGWFAFRGVLIFPGLEAGKLIQKLPEDRLKTDANIKNALERFVFHWEDWLYRDVIPVKDKYSEEQKEYFETQPGKRWEIISKWISQPPIQNDAIEKE